jgi:protein-tyrosine phosphatase
MAEFNIRGSHGSDNIHVYEKRQQLTKSQDEWVRLDTLKKTCNYESVTGTANSWANRYPDIIPYDSTLVPTMATSTNPGGYINASFVKHKDTTFIATQEPLITTVEDFFNMCKMHNVKFVVSLVGEPLYKTTVETKVVEYRGSITISHVVCQNQHEMKIVSYIGWPDKKIPANTDDFDRLVKTVIDLSKTGLGVIHCSAGIGRTGSLLAAIFKILYSDDSLIEIVHDMRKQRVCMVQTCDQYRFVSRYISCL